VKLPRIRIRFGLRGLLICVSLCGIVAAIFAHEKRLADEQTEIVSHLQEIGFVVGYTPRAEWIFGSRLEPGVWRRWLGDDMFDRVTDLCERIFDYSSAGDVQLIQALPFLRKLPNEFTLYLVLRRITPDGVRSEADVRTIRSVEIAFSKADSGSLDAVHGLPALKGLGLTEATISDSAIDRLTKLHQLEFMLVSRTALSKARINRLLHEMPNCVIYAVDPPEPVSGVQ
jgi:hypothetical protein